MKIQQITCNNKCDGDHIHSEQQYGPVRDGLGMHLLVQLLDHLLQGGLQGLLDTLGVDGREGDLLELLPGTQLQPTPGDHQGRDGGRTRQVQRLPAPLLLRRCSNIINLKDSNTN